MIREIVRDPFFLSRKSEPATKEDMQVIRDLLDTIQANQNRCVGMAANMIGSHKTILVAFLSGKYQIMVNPEIIAHSVQAFEKEESCLSLTGSRKVTRYQTITVAYLDQNFKKRKSTFRALEAQIIQHEIDHFSGILV